MNRIGVLRPLRIRDFALVWTGMTVSLLGDGIYMVAIAWQVYSISNTPCLGSDFDIASAALRARTGLDFARDLGEYIEHPQTSGRTRCPASRSASPASG